MKADVILVTRVLERTQAILEEEFNLLRLYEAADRPAFLKEVAPRARGLATFGPAGADAKFMDALPKLEIISHFGVGVDSIDLAAAKKRGIIVTNTPDVLNDCVADTAMSLVLNVLRQFPQSEAYLRSGYWATRGAYPLTSSLGGKTLGVLGLGRIGEAIAQRAQAFGMKIRYHNRTRKKVPYGYDTDAVTLARNSDVLLVATPGGAETSKIVDARVLDALGPEGYVVNISRGSTIDEPALLAYLKDKRIAGAGLDVFENEPGINPEFFALPNAVLYPHVASATNETRFAMGMLQVDNLRAHFAGKPVLTRVV
ncbi:MAG: 2-hydroxyacid dehydrogenase [Betaproteobacteria bacterium]|nr:MAG: 2-hydroxyacid dehydrogenase [Betaproteobacteria bacterium]